MADYAFAKLELTRLTNNKFATRLVKSPTMPEISVTFMVTSLNYSLIFLTNKYLAHDYNSKQKYIIDTKFTSYYNTLICDLLTSGHVFSPN